MKIREYKQKITDFLDRPALDVREVIIYGATAIFASIVLGHNIDQPKAYKNPQEIIEQNYQKQFEEYPIEEFYEQPLHELKNPKTLEGEVEFVKMTSKIERAKRDNTLKEHCIDIAKLSDGIQQLKKDLIGEPKPFTGKTLKYPYGFYTQGMNLEYDNLTDSTLYGVIN